MSTQIEKLNTNARYFILRNGDSALSMRDISMSADKKALTTMLDTLPQYHQQYLKPGHKARNFRYKSKTGEFVLNEVHLYIPPDSLAKAGSSYVIDLNKIQKMEVLKKDAARTTGSYIVGFVFLGVAVLAVGIVIFAASGGIGFD
jgi:hypothetical protein